MKVAKPVTNKVVGEATSRETAEAPARGVLSNPVIEDFRVEVEG
jgi:phosphoribosylformylglycinamidine (FGAM) synthase PurS component